MSEYDFYEGGEAHADAAFGDAGSGSADFDGADFGSAGLDGPDLDAAGYDDAGYAADDADHADGALADDDVAEYADFDADGAAGADPAWGAGVLDGLDFAFDGVDITTLDDAQFDASYDLIGSAPDEGGWWEDLASDHNHDAAYDVVSYDQGTSAYVTR